MNNPLWEIMQDVKDTFDDEDTSSDSQIVDLKERLNSLIVEYGPAAMTLSAADKLAGDLVTIILEGRRP